MPRAPFNSAQTRSLLAALLVDPSTWRHGYDLARQTGLKSGTLYPLLLRLHDNGLLAARWSPSTAAGRPPRHEYRLTRPGLALARQQAQPDIAPARRTAGAHA